MPNTWRAQKTFPLKNLLLKNFRTYRVFIKYCVFSLKCCDFSELCQFCCSAGVLPAWFVYTHWHRGKKEKGQSPEYLKIFGKNTIFNEHPVYSCTIPLYRGYPYLTGKKCMDSTSKEIWKVVKVVIDYQWPATITRQLLKRSTDNFPVKQKSFRNSQDKKLNML